MTDEGDESEDPDSRFRRRLQELGRLREQVGKAVSWNVLVKGLSDRRPTATATRSTIAGWLKEGHRPDQTDDLVVVAALIVEAARGKGAGVENGLLDGLAEVDWAHEHREAGRFLQPARVHQARVARNARTANRETRPPGGDGVTAPTGPRTPEGLPAPGPERVPGQRKAAPNGPDVRAPVARRGILRTACLGAFAGLGALTTWATSWPTRGQSWSAVRTVAQPEGSQGLSAPVFSPDGAILAATGTDNSGEAEIYLWRTGTGRLLGIIDGDSRLEWQAAFSPDGHVIATATGGPESAVSFWDVDGRQRLARSDRGMFNHYGIAYGSDGKSIIVGTTGPGGSVSIWDAALTREIAPLPQAPGGASALTVSADGSALAAVGADGEAKLWALGTRRLRCSVSEDEDLLNCVAVSADGALLATGTMGGRVSLWDGATGRRVREAVHPGHPEHPGPVWSLAFNVTSDLLAASLGDSGAVGVCVWDPAGYRPTWLPREAEGTMTVKFSPDGHFLAGTRRGEIVLWEQG